MPSATARVTTDRPARYGKQLCDHLGRRLATSWDGAHGVIPLPDGTARCELDATDEALVLTAWGRDAPSLAAVQDVTGRHLERFGARNELRVSWERLDGGTGPSDSERRRPGIAAGVVGRLRRAARR